MKDINMTAHVAEAETLALIYAVAKVQSLPHDRQELSNMLTWCEAIRGAHTSEHLAHLLWQVEDKVQQEINLWPEHGGEGDGGVYTDEEADRRDTVRAMINDRKARFAASGILSDAPASDVVTFIN